MWNKITSWTRRNPANSSDVRIENSLKIILISSIIAIVSIWVAFYLLGRPINQYLNLILFPIVVFSFCLFLIQRGHQRYAGLLFLSTIWSILTYTSWYVIEDFIIIGNLGYLIIIIASALLLGRKMAYFYTIISFVSAIVLSIAQSYGFTQSSLISLSKNQTIIIEAVCFIMIALMVRVYLNHTIRSQRVIQQKQDKLETISSEVSTLQDTLEQKSYFNTFLKNNPIAVAIISEDRKIKTVNPAFEELFGYKKDDVLTKNIDNLITTGTTKDQAEAFTEKILSGESIRFECQRQRKNGDLVQVEIYGEPVIIDEEITEILVLYNDISDQIHSQEKIEQLLNRQVAVNKLGQALGETRHLDTVYKKIYEHITKLIDTQTFIISLYDEQEKLISAGYVVHDGKEADLQNFPAIPLEKKGIGTQSRVIHSRKPYNIPDLRKTLEKTKTNHLITTDGDTEDSKTYPKVEEDEFTKAALLVPMNIKGRTIGVMQVQSLQKNAYSQDDIATLSALANQAALAIENARLYEKSQLEITTRKQAQQALKKKTTQQEQLIESAKNLTESLNTQKILNRIASRTRKIVDAHGCTIYLLDDDGKTLNPVVAIDPPYEEEILSTPIDIDSSLTGKAVKEKRSMVFENLTQYNGALQIPGTPIEHDEQMIVVPMISDQNVFGAMCINRMSGHFDEEDLSLAKTFAVYASTALQNAQSHEELLHEVEVRSLTETALRTSEESYRTLFDNAGDSIFVCDYNGNILDANKVTNQRLGYNSDELALMNISDLVPSDSVIATIANIREAFESNFNLFETAQLTANGYEIPVELGIRVIEHKGKPAALTIARDITERKRNQRQHEIYAKVSSALRQADTRAEMLPIILEKVDEMLSIDGAMIVTPSRSRNEYLIEHAIKGAASSSGKLLPKDKLCGKIITSREQILLNNIDQETSADICLESITAKSVAGAPMTSKEKTIGALMVFRDFEITDADMRLLSTIADISANAIHRASLHEETLRRVRHLNALHTIDKAITKNINLETTIKILLEQVTNQLNVNAADILQFDSQNQNLQFLAGWGFRYKIPARESINIDDNIAGKIVLNHQPIIIRNKKAVEGRYTYSSKLMADEDFGFYFGVPLLARDKILGVMELYRRTPFDPDMEWMNLLDSLVSQASIAIENASLFNNLQQSNIKLTLAYDKTLEGWAKALEMRDEETEGHTRRVTDLTVKLAQTMGLPESDLVHLRRGALLHDIGKMGIPDEILTKNGPLDENEWEVMYKHPVNAYNLLSPIPFLHDSLDIPYCHHEKWNGSGYPRGLKGEQIPLAARIFAVVDVWDALTSDRPYRQAWSAQEAYQHILDQSGRHFDPEVVQKFTQFMDKAKLKEIASKK